MGRGVGKRAAVAEVQRPALPTTIVSRNGKRGPIAGWERVAHDPAGTLWLGQGTEPLVPALTATATATRGAVGAVGAGGRGSGRPGWLRRPWAFPAVANGTSVGLSVPLVAGTGGRPSELLRLRWGDLPVPPGWWDRRRQPPDPGDHCELALPVVDGAATPESADMRLGLLGGETLTAMRAARQRARRRHGPAADAAFGLAGVRAIFHAFPPFLVA